MRDTIGWRMAEALRAQAAMMLAEAVAARYAKTGKRLEATAAERVSAKHEGAALGHAFRALELARYGA
jgi:hypothetical protein